MQTPREFFKHNQYTSPKDVLAHVNDIKPLEPPHWQKTKPKILKKKLRTLLLRGAEPHHAVVYALYGKGYNQRQIAEKMEFNSHTVHWSLTGAKRILGEGQLRRTPAKYAGDFKSAEAFMRHVLQLSRILSEAEKTKTASRKAKTVSRKVGRKRRELTKFERSVLEATKTHMIGLQVDRRGIAETFWRNGNTQGAETKEELIRRVWIALRLLRARKILKGSRKRIAILRKATREEIEKNLHLVDTALARPWGMQGTRLARRWRTILDEKDARSVANEGLIAAIETHDPDKGPLEKHAGITIASRLADAVRKKIIEAQREKGKKTLDEEKVVAPVEINQDPATMLSLIHSWQEKGVIRSHEAVVLALRRLGHYHKAIGNHFKVTGVRAYQIGKEAMKKLRESGAVENTL